MNDTSISIAERSGSSLRDFLFALILPVVVWFIAIEVLFNPATAREYLALTYAHH